ncbi:MAG: hypothetical protein IT196_18455, partial [Acidimicrobiales bacterium]|nr:hypothetical protein [Acidimicrobiales bacterium]
MKLRKRDVELLLDRIDDDPEGALVDALKVVLERRGDVGYEELVGAAPIDDITKRRLLKRDSEAMYDLAA